MTDATEVIGWKIENHHPSKVEIPFVWPSGGAAFYDDRRHVVKNINHGRSCDEIHNCFLSHIASGFIRIQVHDFDSQHAVDILQYIESISVEDRRPTGRSSIYRVDIRPPEDRAQASSADSLSLHYVLDCFSKWSITVKRPCAIAIFFIHSPIKVGSRIGMEGTHHIIPDSHFKTQWWQILKRLRFWVRKRKFIANFKN